jgi:tetratricopeptide (TPR) repeat protein
MKNISILVLFLFSIQLHAQSDSIELNTQVLEIKVNNLKHEIEILKRDQLNYQIEKDLIKDTYSNNYDKLNLFITGILLLFGFFGVLGIRDINSIKKEHKDELEKLKSIQLDLEAKSKDFEQTKTKYDKEIKEIIEQNEEQNRKLKILEIKDKIDKLLKERDHQRALEFCAVALEMAPDDCDLLNRRSSLYARTFKYNDAITNLKRVLDIEPDNSTANMNLAEIYLFSGQKEKFDEIYKGHESLFASKDERLIEYFELIDLFIKGKFDEIKDYMSKNIERSDLNNKKQQIDGWDFYDAMVFLANKPESDERKLLQKYTWYLAGSASAQEVISLLGEEIVDEENK